MEETVGKPFAIKDCDGAPGLLTELRVHPDELPPRPTDELTEVADEMLGQFDETAVEGVDMEEDGGATVEASEVLLVAESD